MGWSFGGDREKFTLDEMIAVFSWDRMSLGGPVFDLEKLKWLNEQYLHELDYGTLADTLIAWRVNKEFLLRVLPLVRERVRKLDEIIPAIEYFFSGDLDYAPVLAEMAVPEVAPADVGKGLLDYVERFEAKDGWSAAQLEEIGRAWGEVLGWKTKHAFMLLRLAVTGRKASPPLFQTMEVLGKELVRRRLREAAKAITARAK
jgi:glutamyl-tRNA synthetase